MEDAVQVYKDVLHYDNTHVEAIACIATQHFYTDQPEIALRYFRYSRIKYFSLNGCIHADISLKA